MNRRCFMKSIIFVGLNLHFYSHLITPPLPEILQGRSSLPLIGEILLWGGSVHNLPDGYHVCDGSGGTPDLRNQFSDSRRSETLEPVEIPLPHYLTAYYIQRIF